MADYASEEQDEEKSSPGDRSDLPTKKEQERIIEESGKRFKLCEDAEHELRELSLDDLKFRAGDQWIESIKARRIAKKKPWLTLNYLPTREKQILNEYRQNRSAIKVNPVDGKADPDTADVLGGIIRHIEYDSSADDIWDTALASSTRGGFSFVGLMTEFESPYSFQQVIKIRGFRNPFQVYLDCTAQKPDRSDAKFGHIFETYTKEEYQFEFPDSDLASLDSWGRTGNHDPEWLSKDSVRIAEYFYFDYEDDKIYLVRNRAGEQRTMRGTEFEKLSPKAKKVLKVLDERDTKIPSVKWCKHNPLELLNATKWLGKWIPIIPILGDELDVDGKLILEGMIRHAKDPMRMQNYMSSAMVEAIALAPTAPYVAVAGSTEQHPEWKDANNENYSVLIYDPININGNPSERPQRQSVEPSIQAITQARAQFADDFRQITGIHEAQLGAPSNEKSGTAINARKSQGELSNFHWIDNCTRARKFLGKQMLDLIPKVYSTAQEIRIVGDDGAQKVVKVNQEFALADGSKKKYMLDLGRYDLTINNQPSYATRRQAAVDSMLDLTRSYPQIAQIAGDIIVGAMDFPDHEKLAARLKKALPPGMADDPTDTDPKNQLMQEQAKNQQLQQQQQLLTQALQHEIQLRETKQVEMSSKADIEKAKIDANERIEILKLTVQRDIAEITTKAQDARERMKLDAALDQSLHVAAHEVATTAGDRQHAKELAAQQAQAAQQQQAQGAAQAQESQASDQQFQAQQAEQQAQQAEADQATK